MDKYAETLSDSETESFNEFEIEYGGRLISIGYDNVRLVYDAAANLT